MLRWLLVDLNSYFASVEQQMNPSLRGKPVAVVPMLAETTSCIAASYEAKAFGVKTGTPVYEARKMCPGITFIAGNHDNYIRYHQKIVEAVESCLPVGAVMSIDEMACRLTGRDQKLENAIQLAKDVKNKILKVGDQLKSSVGIAPNRFLAKVASDMQKPDGLVVIEEKDLPQKLMNLKLRDFPGIGHGMEERLLKSQIRTTPQLLKLNPQELRKIWGGIGGERFYRWLRGDDLELEYEANKTIGHSHVLAPDLRTAEGSYAVAQKMLSKAAVRLRKINYWARGLYVSVRYVDQTKWSDEIKMLECQDTLTLLEAFGTLWARRKWGTPLKVSVRLYNLIPDTDRNFSFFEDPKRNHLMSAIDKLNSKFGRNTIYFAGTHSAQTSAPTRIAFTNIPEIEF